MREMLSISALAKQTGVSSKTLRYWESRGLLPQAARSHTGYRLFGPESVQYVAFIQKSKSIGLTLAEATRVLELARNGRSPCPEVVEWLGQKAESLRQQIKLLSALYRRLERLRRRWSRELPCPLDSGEMCCLIEGLPAVEFSKGGNQNAKTLVASVRRVGGASG